MTNTGPDQQQLDALITAFFKAFDNTDSPADLSVLHNMFVPDGIIVNNTNQPPAICSPASFIPPRQQMFDDGALVNFREWEIEAETTIVGSIAHRKTLYGKSGTVRGEAVNTRGHKSFQFIKTEAGWKITALSWWDEV